MGFQLFKNLPSGIYCVQATSAVGCASWYPYFLTTNLTPQEIRERYSDRVTDHCREMFHLILVDGLSYRKA